MHPIDKREWFCGPLTVRMKVFDHPQLKEVTQWSFEMEGTLVVVSERHAKLVIKGIELGDKLRTD